MRETKEEELEGREIAQKRGDENDVEKEERREPMKDTTTLFHDKTYSCFSLILCFGVGTDVRWTKKTNTMHDARRQTHFSSSAFSSFLFSLAIGSVSHSSSFCTHQALPILVPPKQKTGSPPCGSFLVSPG